MRSSFLTSLGLSISLSLVLGGCGSSASDIGGITTAGGAPSTNGGPEPGVLTAGDWDDNLNFALFQNFITEHDKKPTGASFPSADRIVITVTGDDGSPLSNAFVQINDPTHSYLAAPTASDGRVLFFPEHDGLSMHDPVTVLVAPPPGQPGVMPVSVPLPKMGADMTIKLPSAKQVLPTQLDLAFVVDTTGSMGDEIDYLKAEVQGIADSVKARFSGVEIGRAHV